MPSPKQRKDILDTLLREVDHSLSEPQIEELATTTHGFVGADLVGLRTMAAFNCLRRYANPRHAKLKKTCNTSSDCITEQPALMNSATNSEDHLGVITSPVSNMSVASSSLLSSCTMKEASEIMEIVANSDEEKHILKVTFEDFQKAKREVRPSAMREVQVFR